MREMTLPGGNLKVVGAAFDPVSSPGAGKTSLPRAALNPLRRRAPALPPAAEAPALRLIECVGKLVCAAPWKPGEAARA